MDILLDSTQSKLTSLELFELATHHFCAEPNLPLLVRALKKVLDVDESMSVGDISGLFGCKDRLWRYLAVCLLLCEVLCPVPATDCESHINLLMQKYALA